METVTIQIEISKDFLYAFDLNINKISKELKLLSAIELFREHKLSMGKAADFAEMEKYLFIKELSHRDIPIIDNDIEDIKNDANILQKIREMKKW